MKKLMVLLVAFTLFFMAGIRSSSAQVIVNVRPAEPVIIAPPPPPSAVHVWVKGHWTWNRRVKRYDWVEGAWLMPPRPHRVWVEGFWKTRPHGWVWVPGHWSKR